MYWTIFKESQTLSKRFLYCIKNCQGKMHNSSFSGKFKYGDIFSFILYKTHTGALDYSDHVENWIMYKLFAILVV